MKNFSENLLELNDYFEKNKTLTSLLEENFEILEAQILKHKCVRNNNVKNRKDFNLESSFYDNLAKILKNSSEFYGQDINARTLASIMTRIREKKGIVKYNRSNKKNMVKHENSNQYLQAVVSTPVAVTQQQPAKFERQQKQEEDKSSSVVVEKIDLENESQSTVQIGNLSTVTGLVSQAQLMTFNQVYEKILNTDLGFKLENSDECKINVKGLLLEWINPIYKYKKRSVNAVGESLDKYREINEWEYKILKLMVEYPFDNDGKNLIILSDHNDKKEKFKNTLINFYDLDFSLKEREIINDLIDKLCMVMRKTNKNFFNEIKELRYPSKK